MTNITLLPNTEYATTEMVANYYKVDIEAVQKVIQRNRDELKEDGYKVFKGKELKNIKQRCQLKTRAGSLSLFSKRAILRVGMLLTESEIAKEIRTKLRRDNFDLYQQLSKENQLRLKRYEVDIGTYLKYSFPKNQIKQQVKCGKYKIDFVINDKIAIEVDENGHRGYNLNKETIRTDFIQNNGYRIIRYNPMKQQPYELIKDIILEKAC